MPEKSLNQRLILTGVIVLIGAALLYMNGLKPGLDIAGGFSLIY